MLFEECRALRPSWGARSFSPGAASQNPSSRVEKNLGLAGNPATRGILQTPWRQNLQRARFFKRASAKTCNGCELSNIVAVGHPMTYAHRRDRTFFSPASISRRTVVWAQASGGSSLVVANGFAPGNSSLTSADSGPGKTRASWQKASCPTFSKTQMAPLPGGVAL